MRGGLAKGGGGEGLGVRGQKEEGESTSQTMHQPAALACEIDVGVVVEVTPVAVGVGARKDGLAVGESVLRFVLEMAQSSPRVPRGVPAAGVEVVDHHVLTAA